MKVMKTADYNLQAEQFLTRNGIKFRATLSDSKPCPWRVKDDGRVMSNEPHHFRVTLSKDDKRERITHPKATDGRMITETFVTAGKRIVFDFWSSVADAKAGIKTVSAYDVLASIAVDVSACDEFTGFPEWCDNYGYERDSIKALQTFRRCSAFAKRLQAFFTQPEIEQLQEIQ